MKKVTLYLTGGHTLEFGCDDFSVWRNNVSGKFHKVEWTNADKTFGFDLNQLIAYTIKNMESE